MHIRQCRIKKDPPKRGQVHPHHKEKHSVGAGCSRASGDPANVRIGRDQVKRQSVQREPPNGKTVQKIQQVNRISGVGGAVPGSAQKVSFVEGLDLPLDVLGDVERGWVMRIARLVEGETALEMRRHPAEKRLGLLAVYLMHCRSQLIDGLIDLLLEVVHRLGTRSRRKVIQGIAADIGAVHGKERLLVEIAMGVLDHPEGRIEDVIFPIRKFRAILAPARTFYHFITMGCGESGSHFRLQKVNMEFFYKSQFYVFNS